MEILPLLDIFPIYFICLVIIDITKSIKVIEYKIYINT